MAQAGASIEAFLKLDATGFKTGIDTSIEAVTQFKKTLVEVGKDSESAKIGFQVLGRAVSSLATKIGNLSNASKAVKNFKTLAQGMEYAATAAQRLTTVAQRGGMGIEALNSIIGTWKAGMESATINVNGLATALKNLNAQQSQSRTVMSSSKEAIASLDNSYKTVKNDIDLLARSFYKYGEGVHSMTQSEASARALTQMLRKEYGLSGQKLVEVRNQLNQTTNAMRMYSSAIGPVVDRSQQLNSRINLTKMTLISHKDIMQQLTTKINASKMSLVNLAETYTKFNTIINPTTKSIEMQTSALERNRVAVMGLITGENQESVSLERNSVATRQNAEAKLRAMGYTGKLSIEEEKETASVNKNTTSHYRNASAMSQSSARANQLTSATSRLGKAMSSLRMMGSLVGSMLAYNFAHKLLVATGETIHAKSEMEGYFKMLNFGQGEIDGFNKALDETVHQFQRVNKYSLGETISSIGVEFNLSTEEMKKAMKVTSMITSEYLRAGRNANEASLAVKDVLQGQFQRLSRETGVKGEQLKEAGWSGDTTDVLGLMEALEKVGHDRNWDVFAEKANSINDILTISQNRFGEWSADLVNVVQPAIVSTFNSLMSFSQGVAQGLSSVWQWLNTDGWGQTAVKIGLVGTALLTVSQAFASYRTGMSMVQMANVGFTKTLTSVIFGLKGQQMAEMGVRNAILSKIVGVKAETLAESGLARAIVEKTNLMKLETVEEKLNTLSSEENTTAKKYNAIQTKIEKAEEEGLITTKEAKTLATELDTAMTEANSLASLKQVGVNGGLTASFIALGGAENITAVATGEVSVAMGVLNGVFALSPIGWFMGAVLALAGAFYVLSGGLDSSWDEMKKFNETMQNAGDEQKKAQQYLADLKKEVGENSQAYKDAEESVKNWKGELQSASYWMNDSKKKFEEMNLRMSAGSKPILRDLGVDEKELEEFDATLSHLTLGKNKYYKAEQVLNAQLYNEHSNYHEDLKSYLKDVQENGGDLQEAYEKMSGNYANLAEHSYIANTTDDWWEWMWNSAYAGMDQFWIDWDKFWANPDFEGAINGLWNQFKYLNPFGDIMKHLGLDDFDMGKSLSETLKGLGDWVNGIGDAWNNFWNNLDLAGAINNAWQGLSDWVSGIDIIGSLMDLIFPKGVSASDGSDHPEVADEMYQVIVQPIVDWWNGFMADPLSYIGGVAMGVSGIGGLINALIPDDGGASILNYVNTSIIQPFTLGIQNGIASIPILGDIAQMLGLIPQANPNAQDKGSQLMRAMGNAITTVIGQIPILGDILRLLGIIPQANPTASTNGQNLGDAIRTGFRDKVNGMAKIVRDEVGHIISALQERMDEVGKVASDLGNKVVNGVKSAIDPGSPGIIARSIIGNEFGIYIPQAIANGVDLAYTTAQSYGQSIKDGISSTTGNLSMDGMVQTYETDAQMVAQSSQLMGTTTTTAFNDMSNAVNQSTSQMGSNVANTYTSIGTKQATLLNNMKTKNTTAYNEMYTKSNQSLLQMRDSTSNVTHQMTNAWDHMKNNIVASANQLKSESTSHFNQLSNTIGSFYRKIQNPSSWGSAGSPHGGSTRRNTRAGRAFSSTIRRGGYAGGSGHRWGSSNTMTISALKHKLFPSGTGYGDMFDGFKGTDVVDVSQFLSMMMTEGHGFGGWNYSNSHYNYIKNKSDQWGMKSPTINLKGGIPTNADYKVGDFENGSPKISFSSFQSMAESIFSAIPYRFYYDSDWKGSWLGALQAGACNCWDGAHALLAFAQSCGFSGGITHGTWVDPDGTTYPHVWATINGKKMDTTAWQQRGSWSAGSPNVGARNSSNNSQPSKIEVTVNFNEPVYGVDDLNTQIEEGIDKGLQKHFNKSYAIGI